MNKHGAAIILFWMAIVFFIVNFWTSSTFVLISGLALVFSGWYVLLQKNKNK